MPYTLRPSKVFVKDPNSTGYLPQNVITEESTQEQLSQIQSAGTTQVNTINTQGNAKVAAIETKGEEVLESIPDDYLALSGEVSDLKRDIITIATGKRSDWEKATYGLTNGQKFSSTTQITIGTPQGVSTGVNNISADGLIMYIAAWDTQGNYIGHYNSDHVFTKDGSKYATYTEFDCTLYPDYVFRPIATFSPASTSITTNDGDKITFSHFATDKTLTKKDAPANAKAVGDTISNTYTDLLRDLRNASSVTSTGKLSDWKKETYAVTTGNRVTTTQRISNRSAQGVPTGVKRITSDGVVMYVLAWDLDGNYIGFYNSDEEFSKVGAKYATWTDFDCTLYPDYVFRVVAVFDPISDSITPDDGEKVTFYCTDQTLSIAHTPADGKAVGEALDAVGDAVDTMQMDGRTKNFFYTITSSDLESGYWGYSTKIDNTKRLRNKVLFKVRKGMSVKYTNPTQRVYFGILETASSSSYLQVTGWIDAGQTNRVFYIEHDGFMTFIVDSAVDITPSEFACTVTIQNEMLYYDLAHEITSGLYKMFKRAGVIGDSISVGYIDGRNTARNLPYSWPKRIMQDADVPWLNFGTSGQTTLTWASNATYGKVQLEAENNKCQAYIICLGANDEWGSVSLGTTSDVVDEPDTVATTFYGGYNRIIQIIKRKNPNAKIFCCTMPIATESKGYNNAVRYLATEHYTTDNNVFLVDLAKNYRQCFYNDEFGLYVDKYNSDATNHAHYSPLGYRLIASLMEQAIDETIFKNQLCFMDIDTISYDTATPTANTMTE